MFSNKSYKTIQWTKFAYLVVQIIMRTNQNASTKAVTVCPNNVCILWNTFREYSKASYYRHTVHKERRQQSLLSKFPDFHLVLSVDNEFVCSICCRNQIPAILRSEKFVTSWNCDTFFTNVFCFVAVTIFKLLTVFIQIYLTTHNWTVLDWISDWAFNSQLVPEEHRV